MPRKPTRSESARPEPLPVEGSPGTVALLAILAVAAAIVVFRGSLGYFFGQDDFTGLA